MKRLIISGAMGRMGRMIAAQAGEAGFEVVAGLDRSAGDLGFPVYADCGGLPAKADVLIDFSGPAALPGLLRIALERGLPCVLGATGYGAGEDALIDRAARDVPVFQASNMSLGVYALRLLAMKARELLPGFDVEIIEKHHSRKLDAPSGTALSLLSALQGPEDRPVYGRHGSDALRQPGEIGVHAVRGGTDAGEHEVGFYGQHERLLLTHAAESRAVFASGALRAAAWLIAQPAGRYGMADYMRSAGGRRAEG